VGPSFKQHAVLLVFDNYWYEISPTLLVTVTNPGKQVRRGLRRPGHLVASAAGPGRHRPHQTLSWLAMSDSRQCRAP